MSVRDAGLVAATLVWGCTEITGRAGMDAGTGAGVVTDGGAGRDAPAWVSPPADCPAASATPGAADPGEYGEVGGDLFYGILVKGSRLDAAGRLYVYGGFNNCVSASSGPDGAVYRFTPDGQLDPSFGGTGRVCVGSVAGGVALNETFFGMDIDGAGRLVLVGNSDTATRAQGLIVRLDPTHGDADETFGTLGYARYDLPLQGGATTYFYDVVVQGDRIVVVGNDWNIYGGLATQGFVAAVRGDGSMDPTFNQGAPWYDLAAAGFFALARHGDGYVVVGSNRIGHGLRVVRLTAAGIPDVAFGTQGVATHPGIPDFYTRALVVDDRGGVVAAGAIAPTNPDSPLGMLGMERVDVAGQPDLSFGHQGVVSTGDGWDFRYVLHGALARGCDGRLLVGAARGPDVVLYRYFPTGAPDLAFGHNGAVLLPTPDSARALGGQSIDVAGSDGRITVVTGTNNTRVGHWRYFP